MTDIARDIHIRQELHFDAQFTLSLACFTAPAMHIERKTPRLVTAYFTFRQLRIQLADLVEQARICSRVRARCATYWRLVNINDLIEVLNAFNFFVLTCRGACPHQL